jgi:hypothetical protein
MQYVAGPMAENAFFWWGDGGGIHFVGKAMAGECSLLVERWRGNAICGWGEGDGLQQAANMSMEDMYRSMVLICRSN